MTRKASVTARRLFIRDGPGPCGTFLRGQDAPVAAKGLQAAIIGRFRFLGEKAAGNALVVIAVMRDAVAAFAVMGAVIGTGTGTFVGATHEDTPFKSARAAQAGRFFEKVRQKRAQNK